MTEAAKQLTEAQLEELRVAHKKIGIVEWNDHVLVFRRPSRDECREYRVALEHPSTKADANEMVCQRTIVAFDLDTNPNTARPTFTDTFLKEESPMFCSTPKCKLVLGALMGLVEEEDLADMGKGVSLRPSPRPRTPTV